MCTHAGELILLEALLTEQTHYVACILSDPAPAEVRVVGVVNGSDSSTVTIEWTPPTVSSIEYTITTTPIPISPTMSVTTTSPTIDIIVEYNRDYTITVSIETCAGSRQNTITVFVGKKEYTELCMHV